jgi:PAS domain-containing protein
MPQLSSRPPGALRFAVIALALLPALGVLVATRDAFAAAVALALGPVTAGGAWAMAHRTILARAERLAAAADRLAAGDLAARRGLRRAGLGRLGRAVDALADSAEALARRAHLLEAAPAAIVALDLDGRVTHANAAALALLDVAAGAVHGRPLHELLHGAAPDHDAGACPLLAAAGGRTASEQNDAAELRWTAAPVRAGGQVEAIAVLLERRDRV